MDDAQQTIRWRISVPIFKNAVFLKQLGIAIGIPFGVVVLMIVLTSRGNKYGLYVLGLIGILFFFTWLLIMLVYGGKYAAEFTLDQKGARCRTQPKQAKKNRVINSLAIALGLFSGNPAVAGAGMLAQSRQRVFLAWNRVTRVKYNPRHNTILLRGGWAENIALFCTPENYAQVELFVKRSARLPEGKDAV